MKYLSIVLLFSVSLSPLSCASPNRHFNRSGFLDDYAELRVDRGFRGPLAYYRPKNTQKTFSTVLIEPITVIYHPGVDKTAFKPQEVAELKRSFRRELIDALRNEYPVVDHSGAGVLRIRAAITNLHATVPLLSVLANAGTTKPVFGMGGACMELEAVDSATQERVFTIVDNRRAKDVGIAEGFAKWSHTERVFSEWAWFVRRALDRASGKLVYDRTSMSQMGGYSRGTRD